MNLFALPKNEWYKHMDTILKYVSIVGVQQKSNHVVFQFLPSSGEIYDKYEMITKNTSSLKYKVSTNLLDEFFPAFMLDGFIYKLLAEEWQNAKNYYGLSDVSFSTDKSLYLICLWGGDFSYELLCEEIELIEYSETSEIANIISFN